MTNIDTNMRERLRDERREEREGIIETKIRERGTNRDTETRER